MRGGAIAEQAAGQGYAEALRMHVLAPGGLMHTYVEADESWAEPTATGYVVVAMGPPQETTGFYHASQAWSALQRAPVMSMRSFTR